VTIVDVSATVVAAAGVELPWKTHGHDLRPLLEKPDADWPHAAFMEQTQWAFGSETDVGVTGDRALGRVPWWLFLRQGKYKYIRTLVANEIEELYDLEVDPREQTNLALDPANRERLAKFREALLAELRRTEAGMVDHLPRVRETASRETSSPEVGKAWTNSVGMKFLPVPGVKVMFSKYETTNADYRKFRPNHHTGEFKGHSQDGDRQPVMNVSLQDAKAFCKWLTETERKQGLLMADQSYVIPTDWEWSVAIGLYESPTATSQQRMHGRFRGYPWGKQWPPPPRAGNFSGEETQQVGQKGIVGYRDDHIASAPVGSYDVGLHGLYDMSGNAWEYCDDYYDENRNLWVLRGGAWNHGVDHRLLLSACRGDRLPDNAGGFIYGFRCVLVVTEGDPKP
jgi:formylglycine-generating enzyme required for sulfatase activity